MAQSYPVIHNFNNVTKHVQNDGGTQERALNFVGKIFVFLVGKKICGVLNFVAMAAW